MRTLLSRPHLTAALIAACLHASPCAAQQRAYAWEAPPAEDAQWEQRRESYRGGPIRPGGQLERSANPLFGAGITVHARLGHRVEEGQPLATLEIGERQVDVANLAQRIEAAFEISDAEIEVPKLVLGPVDEVDPTTSSLG